MRFLTPDRSAQPRFAGVLPIRSAVFLAVVSALLVVATRPALAAAEVEVQNVMQGQVQGLQATVNGSGQGYYGDSLKASFSNQTTQEFTVAIPIGLRLLPDEERIQNEYAAGGEHISVPPGDSSAVIKGFCGEQHDGGPGSSTVFRPGGFADSELLRTLEEINHEGAFDMTGQAAVWHATDGMDISGNQAAQNLFNGGAVPLGKAAGAAALAALLASAGMALSEFLSHGFPTWLTSLAAGPQVPGTEPLAPDTVSQAVTGPTQGAADTARFESDVGLGPPPAQPFDAFIFGEPPFESTAESFFSELAPAGPSDESIFGAWGDESTPPSDKAPLLEEPTSDEGLVEEPQDGGEPAEEPQGESDTGLDEQPGEEPAETPPKADEPPADKPADKPEPPASTDSLEEILALGGAEHDLSEMAVGLSDKGFYVRNPGLDVDGLAYVDGWFGDRGLQLVSAVGDATIGRLTGNQGITCDDYVRMTKEGVKQAFDRAFDGKAKVEIISFEEKSTLYDQASWGNWFDSCNRQNHILFKATLPSGHAVSVDFWDNARRDTPIVREWDETRDIWKKGLGEDEFYEFLPDDWNDPPIMGTKP